MSDTKNRAKDRAKNLVDAMAVWEVRLRIHLPKAYTDPNEWDWSKLIDETVECVVARKECDVAKCEECGDTENEAFMEFRLPRRVMPTGKAVSTFDEQCDALCAKFGLSREDLGLMALLWISSGTGNSLAFVAWADACTQEEVDAVVNPPEDRTKMRDGSGNRTIIDPDNPAQGMAADLVVLNYVENDPGISTEQLAGYADITEVQAECILNRCWAKEWIHKIEHQRWMPGPDDDAP